MGQEASLPADGDDLEELAPPSHTTAGLPASSSGHHHGGGGGKASKVPQKMLNMMRAFEQSNRGDDSLQKMESTESGAIPTTSAHSVTNGNSNTASSSSTTKASLFRPTVAARGVISQMRSLRINKQSSAMSEKQKAAGAQDWEKQWYADDDDDDDDSDDEGDDTAAIAPQQPGGGGGGYGSSAAMPPGTGGIVTPTNAALARPGLDVGPHGSLSNVHLVTPPDLGSTRIASSQMLAYSEASMSQQQYQQYHQQHQQHIDVHMQPEEVFTGVVDPLGKKPDVSMFLPMLRVLGKGSFGKVRLYHSRSRKCNWFVNTF
jgi:hypothetical protein